MKDPRATITTPLLAGATYFDLLAILDEKCQEKGITDYLVVSTERGGIAAVPIPEGAELVHVRQPVQLYSVYSNTGKYRAKKTSLIPFTAPDWRTSLRQRPAKNQSPRPESAQNKSK